MLEPRSQVGRKKETGLEESDFRYKHKQANALKSVARCSYKGKVCC